MDQFINYIEVFFFFCFLFLWTQVKLEIFKCFEHMECSYYVHTTGVIGYLTILNHYGFLFCVRNQSTMHCSLKSSPRLQDSLCQASIFASLPGRRNK